MPRYPSGELTPFERPIAPDAAQSLGVTFGKAFYVNSGKPSGVTGRGASWADAFLTLAEANSAARAYDTIFIAPGHAEAAIAGATTVLLSKANVTVIGLGRGASRPTFTLSHANGNIPISGAGIKLANVLITVSGTTDVTAGITVTGADVELEDVELRDASATAQFATGIVLSTGAARCKITRPIFRGHASGDANVAAISCAVALDGVEIIAPNLDGLFASGGIYNVTTAMTNLTVDFSLGGIIRNRHATADGGIVVAATTTGSLINPRVRSATNDADGFNLALVAAAMQVYNPLVVNADGERGGAWGTASAAA